MSQNDLGKRGRTGYNVDGRMGKIHQQQGGRGGKEKGGCGKRDSRCGNALGYPAATANPDVQGADVRSNRCRWFLEFLHNEVRV